MVRKVAASNVFNRIRPGLRSIRGKKLGPAALLAGGKIYHAPSDLCAWRRSAASMSHPHGIVRAEAAKPFPEHPVGREPQHGPHTVRPRRPSALGGRTQKEAAEQGA